MNRLFAQNPADLALAAQVAAELSELATVRIDDHAFPYITIIAPADEVRKWCGTFPQYHARIDRSDDLFGSGFLRANISVCGWRAARLEVSS